jgi:molecular chaperone DnaK (HSP70)
LKENERPHTKDNYFVGKLELAGILPAANRAAQIEVSFEVDVNSILRVSVKDLN